MKIMSKKQSQKGVKNVHLDQKGSACKVETNENVVAEKVTVIERKLSTLH